MLAHLPLSNSIKFNHIKLVQSHKTISLLRSLQCDYDKKNVFISPLCGLRCDNEKKLFFFIFSLPSLRHDQEIFFVLLLLSLLHDQERKKFFSFSQYVHYAMIKLEKKFFSFIHYVPYAMIKREKNFFFI